MNQVFGRAMAVVGLALACTAACGQCEPTEVAHLVAEDAQSGDYFGYPLAIDGDTIVAMANPDPGHPWNGIPYVFVDDGGGWVQQARLALPEVEILQRFGNSVGIAGDSVVIGAPRAIENFNAGSAFVYTRDDGAWVEDGTLFAPDRLEVDEFGQVVAMDGETCVVSASEGDVPGDHPGSVYVFVREGDAWTEQARIVPSDLHDFDFFGYRVAISGDTILVGAKVKGTAYVFIRDAGVWSQQEAFAGVAIAAVAIDGDTAVVGRAPKNQPGLAEVFFRENGAWTQEATLHVQDAVYEDGVGKYVAICGDKIVLGAPGDDTEAGVNAGAACLFVRTDHVWTEQSRIFASDGAEGDEFGRVAISGDTLAVAAMKDDTAAGVDTGSVYVFNLACPEPCYADCDGSGTLDLFDFLCFTNAFNAGDAYADCTGDGPLDLFDFLCFVNEFNDGCP